MKYVIRHSLETAALILLLVAGLLNLLWGDPRACPLKELELGTHPPCFRPRKTPKNIYMYRQGKKILNKGTRPDLMIIDPFLPWCDQGEGGGGGQ